MPTTPLIAFAHVAKSFDGGRGAERVRAVDDVSLEVAEGEFLAIVGGSGSGKTTLLRLANRLIEADQRHASRSKARTCAAVDPIQLRRRIGYVFQSGGLFPHMSVAGNIGITPKLLGTPAGEIAARVDELLDLVRLDRALYRDRFPHELSGGQRQRVGVARALAAKPRIVLMDEPFGALDPLTRDALGDDFRDLHRKLGLTTVMITHDMTEAILLADRIAVMRGGRLLAQGTPAELSDSGDAYVGELLRTPRRQAERLNDVAAAGRRGMSFFSDPRWGEALAHLPDYLGNHVRVSVTALALGLAVSLPLAIAARNRPRAARRAARACQHRADGAGAGAAGAVLSAAAGAGGAVAVVVRIWLFRVRISSGRAGAGAVFDAAGAAQHHHRPAGRRSRDPRGRARRRHDAAAIAVHGRTAAGAAGDDGGHPHRGGLGDRHRDAVDADRADQPRQLHLCGAADPELGVRAVRLPRRRRAGARGRSIAGADRRRACATAAGFAPSLGGVGIAALVAATLVPSMARSPSSYIVGAKTFAEQYVLSALIAQRLRAAGLSASSREGLGSNVIFDALAANDIDVYVDYSGTLWANQFHRTDIKPREELLAELKTTLAQQNITLLGELGFENAYALVMPRKRAEALGIRTIADLASHAPTHVDRRATTNSSRGRNGPALQKAYGLKFRTQRQMQPDFMYAAVASGEVDVIAGYTSDGLIAKYDLVVLDDTRHAIPPYDAIVLLAPKRAGDQALQRGAAAAARQDRYRRHARGQSARRRQRRDASSPDAVARWLWEKIGTR